MSAKALCQRVAANVLVKVHLPSGTLTLHPHISLPVLHSVAMGSMPLLIARHFNLFHHLGRLQMHLSSHHHEYVSLPAHWTCLPSHIRHQVIVEAACNFIMATLVQQHP